MLRQAHTSQQSYQSLPGLHTRRMDINTVKPVIRGHSKIDKTKVLKMEYCLMHVKSNAECSP